MMRHDPVNTYAMTQFAKWRQGHGKLSWLSVSFLIAR